jgi:hypothetical protein
MSPEIIMKWLEEYDRVVKDYNIKTENTYNMDETGFSIGKIEATCKKLIQMSCLRFKFQGMYLPSEILSELRGALALFILEATDI